MIVISGALVLVAAVLLVIGVAGVGLGMVYASIAVSLLAFATLTLGVLQRRGSAVPASDVETGSGAASSAEPGRRRSAGGSSAVALAREQHATGGGVAVAERGADDRDGDLDRTEDATSYSPAGTGQDTTAVATPVVPAAPAGRRPYGGDTDGGIPVDGDPGGGAADGIVEAQDRMDDPDDDLDDDLEYGGTVLVVPGRPRYHVDGCRYLVGKDLEEVDVLDAREEGFTACGVCKPDQVLEEELADEQRRLDADARDVADDATPAVVQRSAGPAPKAGAARAAASLQVEPGNVVVIPDRGKYHRGDCRYVRDAPGRQQVPRATATRQGYGACGICRP